MNKKFIEGQEVYTAQGNTLTVAGYLDNGKVVCFYHEKFTDEEGETWTEPGEISAIIGEGDLLSDYPEVSVPQYLTSNIESAKRRIKHLRTQEGVIRDGINALQQTKWKMERDAKSYPDSVVRQLKLFERHLAGEDLLVCWERWGQVTMKRMSELKDNDGDLRMVSIYGNYSSRSTNKWISLYDWTVHQYSDDSGDKFRALVAGDEKEMFVRIREMLDEMSKRNLNKDERTLRAYLNIGVELNEAELAKVKEYDNRQIENEANSRVRELESLKNQAAKLGVSISE